MNKYTKTLDPEDIELLKNGDNSLLARIYETNYEKCMHVLKSLTKQSIHETEDLYMDAIIVLWRKLISDEYENENVQSFLISVANNKWRNKYHSKARTILYEPFELEKIREDSTTFKLKSEVQKREVGLVMKAMSSLEGKCKDLLYKNLYEGKSLEILAQELGYKNYNVIKTSKSRCMKKLRILIENLKNSKNG